MHCSGAAPARLSRLGGVGRIATRTARLTALALAAVVLTGCQGITGSQQIAQVRVIDASPDAPNLDGDPFVFHDYRARVHGVVRRGRIVRRAEDAQLPELTMSQA